MRWGQHPYASRAHAEDCFPPLQGETISGERYPLGPPPPQFAFDSRFSWCWLWRTPSHSFDSSAPSGDGDGSCPCADGSQSSLVWMTSRFDSARGLHFLCKRSFVADRKSFGVLSNGKTLAFEARDEGPIPSPRSTGTSDRFTRRSAKPRGWGASPLVPSTSRNRGR